MLVTPGELACIRFERSCSNEEDRVNGVRMAKVANKKASLHGRQRACWKETFHSGQECVSFLV